MKLLRYIALGIVLLLTGGYLYAISPKPVSQAQTWQPNHTDDGKIAINPHETVGANGSSYAVAFDLKAEWGGSFDVTYTYYRYFCPKHSDVNNGCYGFPQIEGNQHIGVNQNGWVTIPARTTDPTIANSQYRNCGVYQTDISLDSYPGINKQHTYQSAGWFDTGIDCAVPTPTNTPIPQPTATPIPTATNTPIPTATNTPMPTATGTPQPTATGTPMPTATSTPIPTATPTSSITQNCGGDNDRTIQQGTNNQASSNCNNNNNNNNNQNNNNNNQSQSQTQNNNQNVNISFAAYAPSPAQQQVIVQSAPNSSSLPSTGSPFDQTLSLFSLIPVGSLLRKFTRKV